MQESSTNPTKGERLYWLDLAKVIGVFLVVVAHLPFRFNPEIYLFHMPLFFILSGWLYKKRSIGDEFKRSFKSLMAPYLIYSALMFISNYFIYHYDFRWLAQQWLLGNWEVLVPAYRPLWFLLSLFSMRILMAICKDNAWKVSILLFLGAVVYVRSRFYQESFDPFQWSTTAFCFIFFVIGTLKDKYDTFLYGKMKNLKAIHYLLWMIPLIVLGKLNGPPSVNVFRTRFGLDSLPFLTTALGLSYLFVMVIRCKLDRYANRGG
jgi:fucose 4-O-acetylase-like acetyltransferase